MAFVRVASLVEIPEGELRGYGLPWGRVCVAHIPGGLAAFRDECPSDGCSLSDGEIEDAEEGPLLVCPCDRSAFDVDTGEPVRGPAVDPVARFPVRLELGWVEVGEP